jgi:hypothetical protein
MPVLVVVGYSDQEPILQLLDLHTATTPAL